MQLDTFGIAPAAGATILRIDIVRDQRGGVSNMLGQLRGRDCAAACMAARAAHQLIALDAVRLDGRSDDVACAMTIARQRQIHL